MQDRKSRPVPRRVDRRISDLRPFQNVIAKRLLDRVGVGLLVMAIEVICERAYQNIDYL